MSTIRVYDLFLAATLLSKGQMFSWLEVFERKGCYTFEATKDVLNLIEQYNLGLLKVDPNDIRMKRNALKNKIYQSGANEADE